MVELSEGFIINPIIRAVIGRNEQRFDPGLLRFVLIVSGIERNGKSIMDSPAAFAYPGFIPW